MRLLESKSNHIKTPAIFHSLNKFILAIFLQSAFCISSKPSTKSLNITITETAENRHSLGSIQTFSTAKNHSLPQASTLKENITFYADTWQPQDILKRSFQRLIAFIKDTEFDFIEFDSNVANINEDLTDLEWRMKHGENHDIMFYHQLRFVSRVFAAMEHFVEVMDHGHATGDPAQMLLLKMIELNVLLYKLYDSTGAVNYSIQGFRDKVNFFWRRVYYWEMSFRNLEDVRTEIQQSFSQQVLKAKGSLEHLQVYHPRSLEK